MERATRSSGPKMYRRYFLVALGSVKTHVSPAPMPNRATIPPIRIGVQSPGKLPIPTKIAISANSPMPARALRIPRPVGARTSAARRIMIRYNPAQPKPSPKNSFEVLVGLGRAAQTLECLGSPLAQEFPGRRSALTVQAVVAPTRAILAFRELFPPRLDQVRVFQPVEPSIGRRAAQARPLLDVVAVELLAPRVGVQEHEEQV